MRAADLFEQGVHPAEIARRLGVTHQIVSEWRKAWRRAGRDGLRGAGRAGRKPKLSRSSCTRLKSPWPQEPKPTATPMTCGRCRAWLR